MSHQKRPLSLSDAVKLLDLLIHDDAFRASFQDHPATALLQVSEDASRSAFNCGMPAELASVAQLIASRDALITHLTEVSVFSPPHCFLDAGTDLQVQLLRAPESRFCNSGQALQ